jgi:hypothetical protein
MAMQLPDRSFASNSKQNMSVFGPHFTKVYNNHQPVDFEVLNHIPQHKTLLEIDSPITFSEVNKAINKLNAGKSPGLNGIPLEGLKAMGKGMQ